MMRTRRGLCPIFSMRGVHILIDNEETLLARLQPSRAAPLQLIHLLHCRDRVGRVTASRAPVQQAIEELARTSIEQVLKLLDGNDRFQSQTQYRTMWGSKDSKTGGWTNTCAYKQVAKANLDLNKTRMFTVAAKEYRTGGGRPHRCWGRSPTLGHVPNRLNLIHGPLGQNTIVQHLGQKDLRSMIC
jgi:hypothetical protein